MLETDGMPTESNMFAKSEVPEQLINEIKRRGHTDAELLFLAIEITKRTVPRMAEAYERARHTGEEDVMYERIQDGCVEMIEAVLGYLNVLIRADAEDAS